MFRPLLLTLFYFCTCSSIFSQTETQAESLSFSQWEALITRQIKYPIEAIRAKKEGAVVVLLSTNEDGALSDIILKEETVPFFDKQVLNAVESMRDFWTPEMLEGKTPGEPYLLVFNFIMILEGNTKEDQIKSAISLIRKGKPEKAFKIVNRVVNENPYDIQSLTLRSQIHRQLGNEEESTEDLLAYQKLQESVLSQVDIKAFQGTSTRKVIGSF